MRKSRDRNDRRARVDGDAGSPLLQSSGGPKREPFRDRVAAGRCLAEKLCSYAERIDTVVLAVPHGGVPVGFEVAKALGLPLEVVSVRKLGVPGTDEVVCVATPEVFRAADWYRGTPRSGEEEELMLLREAAHHGSSGISGA